MSLRAGLEAPPAAGGRPLAGELPMGRDARLLLLCVGLLTLLTGLFLFLAPGPAGVGSNPPAQPPAGDQLWPWPLRTPLNTRFFGAFFISVGVGALFGLRERSWERVRILFPSGIVFTALGIVATLLSFASFKPERIATWAFLVLYIAVLLGELWIYISYERRRSSG